MQTLKTVPKNKVRVVPFIQVLQSAPQAQFLIILSSFLRVFQIRSVLI